jgi:hypothetical protein
MPEPADASSALLQTALAELMVVAHRTDDDPDGVITDVNDLVDRLLDPGAGPFPSGYEVRVRLYASSVIINAAMVSNDVASNSASNGRRRHLIIPDSAKGNC